MGRDEVLFDVVASLFMEPNFSRKLIHGVVFLDVTDLS